MQLASEGEVVGVDGERGDVQLDLGPHGHTCTRRWRSRPILTKTATKMMTIACTRTLATKVYDGDDDCLLEGSHL